MTQRQTDLIGIGNAIVDVIARCDDDFLASHGMSKGTMRLVESDEALRIYESIGPAIEVSGGSAANTCVGLASFGSRVAFTGRVAGDQLGQIFAHDIQAAGVSFAAGNGAGTGRSSSGDATAAGGLPTARSIILVTPDGERTMNTMLGISGYIDADCLAPDAIAGARMVYLEGYLFDRDPAKEAFHEAIRIAKSAGGQVALSLSDGFCVDRHRADFLALIRNGVDLVFANASELMSLYETDDFDGAAAQLGRDAGLAAVTRSAKGSIVLSEGRAIEIPATPVAEVVDTTGAGDLYAAGFLHGFLAGMDLAKCGRLGSIAASEIISHVGARPNQKLSELV